MPRDSAGVYTLPPGNPVVTGTIIASPWANTTMSDIAAQLNNVLTRDGLLGPIGPFLIQDGTVNAPGLAFNSEPGLGWYRSGVGIVSMASAGGKVAGFDFSTPASSIFSLQPRTPGSSTIVLSDSPDAANRHALVLQSLTTGYALAENVFGTSTPKTLNLGFPAGVTASGPISALSSGAPTTGGLWVGPPNTFGLYDTSQYWVLQLNSSPSDLFFHKANGAMVYRVAGTQLMTVDASGFMNLTGNFACAQGAPNMWRVGAIGNYLGMGAGIGSEAWTWRWNNVSGDIHWLGLSGQTLIAFDASGNAGKASGAGSWLGVSDARFKNVYKDYAAGLDEVLQLVPKWYAYKDTPHIKRVSLIAQDVQPVMPEMITVGPIKRGDIELDDAMTFDPTNLPYALINSVKTLHARISALETNPL